MTTQTLGELMEADNESENSNPLNEIEQHLINDLQDQWKEPATRGDLRNHAVRMDSRFNKLGSQMDAKFVAVDAKFGKIDARFDKVDARFDKMDARLDKIEGRFDGLRSDMQAMIHRNVWASAAAIMTLNLAVLGLVVSILK